MHTYVGNVLIASTRMIIINNVYNQVDSTYGTKRSMSTRSDRSSSSSIISRHNRRIHNRNHGVREWIDGWFDGPGSWIARFDCTCLLPICWLVGSFLSSRYSGSRFWV